ncbi:MAG: 50S ribosomal protein L19e [Candidatus Rehaiarchaeum fermentans]|nr:50S ribosomal protein L19e [Candidatus Rehaiarchaeum fermentans]MCW1293691.1 50S ribosomal protein L19e [Candidatus Rehaiarchaeum fermentans]MCW1297241.1 50S ribosomal protein L19e [Candidatus Rehaiarchaeum fermentans]MCW1302263.1 50S ribosomal protein L19e [Candidatus Rehaiarchaeum fermentans]MCW1311231.1 50S ribosomal protein L19e [Candidatus Rehaiarchaeum fermentans]
MKLTVQKKIISRMMGVGKDRIWFDPSKLKEIKSEITREGLRKLIESGAIKIKPIKGQTHRTHEHKSTPGNKRGKKTARISVTWKEKIRAQRRKLKELKKSGKIDNKTFKEFYRKAKSGSFRSVNHMLSILQPLIKK